MLCVAIILSCFITIQAHRDQLAWVKPCEPGKFYEGKECSKCFCNDKQKLNCGPAEQNCKLSNKAPNGVDFEHFLSHEDLDSLPVVAHKASECNPGLTYRLDCNRCLCLERRSLKCEAHLCPSYDDVNRLRAAELTGNPCQEVINEDCVTCSCTNKKYECQAKKNCIPPSAKGKHPEEKEKKRCDPAKKYRTKDGKRLCTCSKDHKLTCPGKHIKLDVDDAVTCTPGVEFKRECNTCMCNENRTLHCTQDTCDEPVTSDYRDNMHTPLSVSQTIH